MLSMTYELATFGRLARLGSGRRAARSSLPMYEAALAKNARVALRTGCAARFWLLLGNEDRDVWRQAKHQENTVEQSLTQGPGAKDMDCARGDCGHTSFSPTSTIYAIPMLNAISCPIYAHVYTIPILLAHSRVASATPGISWRHLAPQDLFAEPGLQNSSHCR
jgi:hypothetical protein